MVKRAMEENDKVAVWLDGSVDFDTVPRIRKELLRIAKDKNTGSLIIDFTEVTKFDSAGLAMLVELWQLLTERRAGLELRGLSENALRLLRLAQLDQLLGGELSGD